MSQQPPENSDSQQPDANSRQQADSSTPQNVVQGNQNRTVQGNDNQAVLGEGNTAIQGNNNLLVTIKELFLGQQLASVGNPARPKNERILLAVVQEEVKERLSNSLHNAVPINLGKEPQPQQVNCPRNAEIKMGLKPAVPIPDTTTILQVFDSEGIAGKLLILGAPGAGKTTTQLELAQALVKRAEEQPDYPIPVLFNLSSWKDERQSLTDWLVAELKSKYGFSIKLGKEWVDNKQLLPLLDGLDELEPQRQEICVHAINQFLTGENRSLYLVVCSRSEEYENYKNKLNLMGAICLRQLNETQILEYFEVVGQVEFWQTLQQDETLLKLMRTPLFLSITVLSAQELSVEDWQQMETMEARIEHLFDAYWEQQMFKREHSKESYTVKKTFHYLLDKYIRRLPVEPDNERYIQQKLPTPEQTRHWLVWLAKQMQQESKTEFLIEEMQPTLLPMGKIWKYRWLFRLNFLLFFEMIFGLLFGLIGGLSHEAGLLLGLSRGLFIAPFFAFICWMFCSFAMGFSLTSMNIEVVEKIKWSWQKAKNALIFGLYFGLLIGLFCVLCEKTNIENIDFLVMNFPVIFVSIIGISLGIFFAYFQGLSLIEDKTTVTTQRIWSLTKNFVHGGVIFGLMYWLFLELVVGLKSWIFFGVIFGLFFGMTCPPSFFYEKVEYKFLGKINWSIQKVEANTKGWLIFLQIFGLLSVLLNVVLGRVSIELLKLISTSLVEWVKVGLVGGVIFGLILGLFSGLYTIEDVETKMPNQGIWNSTKNFVRVGLIYGLIYGLLSVPCGDLIVAASINMGQKLGTGLLVGLIAGTVAGLSKGGLASIQHFTLRLILYRNGYIPWNYARFLDYCTERLFLQRVGGRYRFIHKLLQDHFAQMEFKRD